MQVGVSVNCADIVRISESVGISLLNKWWHNILQVRSYIIKDFVEYYQLLLCATLLQRDPPQIRKKFIVATEFRAPCYNSGSLVMNIVNLFLT